MTSNSFQQMFLLLNQGGDQAFDFCWTNSHEDIVVTIGLYLNYCINLDASILFPRLYLETIEKSRVKHTKFLNLLKQQKDMNIMDKVFEKLTMIKDPNMVKALFSKVYFLSLHNLFQIQDINLISFNNILSNLTYITMTPDLDKFSSDEQRFLSKIEHSRNFYDFIYAQLHNVQLQIMQEMVIFHYAFQRFVNYEGNEEKYGPLLQPLLHKFIVYLVVFVHLLDEKMDMVLLWLIDSIQNTHFNVFTKTFINYYIIWFAKLLPNAQFVISTQRLELFTKLEIKPLIRSSNSSCIICLKKTRLNNKSNHHQSINIYLLFFQMFKSNFKLP